MPVNDGGVSLIPVQRHDTLHLIVIAADRVRSGLVR
jgi:hypothetical protein